MGFNTEEVYLTCVLQNYEHVISIHMEHLADYEQNINRYEDDLKAFDEEKTQMTTQAYEIYEELQQLLANMRLEAITLKQRIDDCRQKIEHLKYF
ncbi:hypothetical protein [Kurthia huakuii]|uniref:hypothetical protein n=1 Tax=Kurthia huakuii TaxID=1421019 RepID=UPI0004985B32|nr:hypothetical protein [Kurthia huakuii]MBM7699174.1 putative nucleic acid-binding Zn-ribbon protein [Kurthia huakuii]